MRAPRPRSLGVLAVALALAVPQAARADDDGMVEYRQRFRAGLQKYQDGAVAEAVRLWEPIYTELGPKRGWRLAFNLARAYDALGDSTRAVERFRAFREVVAERRAAGETLEPLLLDEDEDARARIEQLERTRGRLVFPVTGAPVAVRVDDGEPRLAGFTAYVAEGDHVVVFDPGTAHASRASVHVAAGEARELAPPPVIPVPSPPPPRIATSPTPPASPTVVRRPFPASVLWISGGVALASAVVPVLTYRSAVSFQEEQRLSRGTDDAAREGNARLVEDYDARKSVFYGTLAIPIALAAATVGLSAWWFLGGRRETSPVASLQPSGFVAAEGFVAGARGRF